jgi:hypothetical protein
MTPNEQAEFINLLYADKGDPVPNTCRCAAYTFPHRHGGGDCYGDRYYCDECGSSFAEPGYKYFPATWGYSGGCPPEEVWYCPDCGKEDPVDMEEENG